MADLLSDRDFKKAMTRPEARTKVARAERAARKAAEDKNAGLEAELAAVKVDDALKAEAILVLRRSSTELMIAKRAAEAALAKAREEALMEALREALKEAAEIARRHASKIAINEPLWHEGQDWAASRIAAAILALISTPPSSPAAERGEGEAT